MILHIKSTTLMQTVSVLLSEGRHVVALGDLNLEDREIGHVAGLEA